MEGLSQANAFLTKSDYAVITGLSQMTATRNVMQAHLKTLSAATTTVTKRKYYCWSCRGNVFLGSKSFTSKKVGHKYEAYYKKGLGVSEKGCK